MSASFYKNMQVKDNTQPRLGYVKNAYRTEDSWMVEVQWVAGGSQWVDAGQLQKVENKAKVKQ